VPPSVPTALYPVFESSFLAGKEGASTPGTAATAFTGIPTGPLAINPHYTPLEDDNLRGANTKVFDLQLGSRYAEITIPESPCYADTIGIPLLSCLGDYTTTGTAASPNSTLNGGVAAGATTITVVSGTGFAANQWVQVDVGSLAEVVQILSVATNTLTLMAATPTRFSHLTGVAITNTTGPYTHSFSLLNMASSTGSTSAQPPTYTVLHRNGIAPTFSADQYTYGHFNALKFQAKKDGWFVWDGKVTSFVRSAPASNITPSFSAVTGLPSWRSTVSVAGSQAFNVTDLTVDLQRELDIVPTADGVQDPYVIGMGPLAATFSMSFDVAANETVLTYLENNTKPTFSWTISNGLSGTSLYSFSIASQLAGFKSAPLSVMRTFWGFKAAGSLIASTTNAGNSGAYSPLMITVINQTPTY
jgi:hypothetical protein